MEYFYRQRKKWLFVACGVFGWLAATAQAQELCSYTAKISDHDKVDQSGQKIMSELTKTAVFNVIRKDRANYYRFNKRDPQDGADCLFSTREGRNRLFVLARKTVVSAKLMRTIAREQPVLRIGVFADHLEIVEVSETKTALKERSVGGQDRVVPVGRELAATPKTATPSTDNALPQRVPSQDVVAAALPLQAPRTPVPVQQTPAVDLLQSYRAALVGSAQYQSALAAAQAGREAVALARAQLLPNVAMNYNHFGNELSKKMGSAVYQAPERYWSQSGALTLRQPLYRPAAMAGYQRSLAMASNADATQDGALQQLGVNVAQAYFDVLLAWQTLEQLQSDRQAVGAQLTAARKSLAAGQGMRTDVDEAQARLDLIEARIFSARDAIALARRALQSETQQEVERVRGLDLRRLVMSPPEPSGLSQWLEMAESRNPQLAALKAEAQAQRTDVDQADAGHLPTLDAVMQRSLSNRDSVYSNNVSYYNTQVGVALNVPIYGGGGISARARQAVANWQEAEQRLEAERRQTYNEVSKTYDAVLQALTKVRALEQAEKSAQQMIISSERGFNAGTRTRLDILNARQQLSQVALELARERINGLMARVRLYALSGMLDEAVMHQTNLAVQAGEEISLAR